MVEFVLSPLLQVVFCCPFSLFFECWLGGVIEATKQMSFRSVFELGVVDWHLIQVKGRSGFISLSFSLFQFPLLSHLISISFQTFSLTLFLCLFTFSYFLSPSSSSVFTKEQNKESSNFCSLYEFSGFDGNC